MQETLERALREADLIEQKGPTQGRLAATMRANAMEFACQQLKELNLFG